MANTVQRQIDRQSEMVGEKLFAKQMHLNSGPISKEAFEYGYRQGAEWVLKTPDLMREQMHDLVIFIDSMGEEALTISTEDILNRYFNHLKQK